MTLSLTIPGEPGAKGRPRFVRATGRTYTPDRTLRFEDQIRAAWDLYGRPTVPDVPLEVTWIAVFARPAGHNLQNGELSASGRRSPWPTRRPDADNLLKCSDALNGLVWRDDAQVVVAHVIKRWAERGESPHTEIHVRCAPPGRFGEEQAA